MGLGAIQRAIRQCDRGPALSLSHTHSLPLPLSLSLSHTQTHTLPFSFSHTHSLSLSHACTYTHRHTHTHTPPLSHSQTQTQTHFFSLSLSLSLSHTHSLSRTARMSATVASGPMVRGSVMKPFLYRFTRRSISTCAKRPETAPFQPPHVCPTHISGVPNACQACRTRFRCAHPVKPHRFTGSVMKPFLYRFTRRSISTCIIPNHTVSATARVSNISLRRVQHT